MQSMLSNCQILKEISPPLVFSFTYDGSISAPFEAHINLKDWSIHIKIRSDIESKYDEKTLCFLVYTLLRHEEGHWTICPFDGIQHLKICAAVKRAYHKVFGAGEVSSALFRMGFNLFEDLIVDKTNIINDSNYKSGTEEIQKIVKKEAGKKPGNLFNILHKVRESFLLGKNTREKGILSVLKTISGEYSDELRWETMAYDFAEALYILIQKRIGKKQALSLEEQMTPSFVSKSIFEKRMEEDSEYRDETTKEYFRSVFSEPGGSKVSQDVSLRFPLEDDPEALDLYFSSRTEDLKLEYFKKDLGSYNYAHLGKRRLAEGRIFGPGKIKWTSTKIIHKDDDESLLLYEKEMPLTINNEGTDPGIIYDLALILDSSGSMGHLFDRSSAYHLLLIAIYSLLYYVKSTDNSYHINYCTINFSDNTYYSGWRDYAGLRDLRHKFILTSTWGATNLSVEALRRMAQEARGAFLAIMVTDGEIDNLKESVDAIREIIEQGNHFCLIQVGDGTSFMSGVKEAGGDVYNIREPSDLSGLILKKGKEHW